MAKKKESKKEEKANQADTATADPTTKVEEKPQESTKVDDLYYGTVIWYNAKGKGYGFIQMDGKKEKEDDIFFHRSRVENTKSGEEPLLEKGDRVSFLVTDPPEGNGKQKPMADEVVLVEKSVKEDEEVSDKPTKKDKEDEEEVRRRHANKQKTGDTTG